MCCWPNNRPALLVRECVKEKKYSNTVVPIVCCTLKKPSNPMDTCTAFHGNKASMIVSFMETERT